MAEENTPLSREELEQQLQHQIMLSIGLKFEEKDELIGKMKSLTEPQLRQLSEVFVHEQQRKEELLSEFFSQHPELYQEFERFSQEHVNQIYDEVEEQEQSQEKQRMQELLQASF